MTHFLWVIRRFLCSKASSEQEVTFQPQKSLLDSPYLTLDVVYWGLTFKRSSFLAYAKQIPCRSTHYPNLTRPNYTGLLVRLGPTTSKLDTWNFTLKAPVSLHTNAVWVQSIERQLLWPSWGRRNIQDTVNPSDTSLQRVWNIHSRPRRNILSPSSDMETANRWYNLQDNTQKSNLYMIRKQKKYVTVNKIRMWVEEC